MPITLREFLQQQLGEEDVEGLLAERLAAQDPGKFERQQEPTARPPTTWWQQDLSEGLPLEFGGAGAVITPYGNLARQFERASLYADPTRLGELPVRGRGERQGLYDIARELGIPGRSSMRKAGLVEAVGQAAGEQVGSLAQRLAGMSAADITMMQAGLSPSAAEFVSQAMGAQRQEVYARSQALFGFTTQNVDVALARAGVSWGEVSLMGQREAAMLLHGPVAQEFMARGGSREFLPPEAGGGVTYYAERGASIKARPEGEETRDPLQARLIAGAGSASLAQSWMVQQGRTPVRETTLGPEEFYRGSGLVGQLKHVAQEPGFALVTDPESGAVIGVQTADPAKAAKRVSQLSQEHGITLPGLETVQSRVLGQTATIPETGQRARAWVSFGEWLPQGAGLYDVGLGQPTTQIARRVQLPEGAEITARPGQVFSGQERVPIFTGHAGLELGRSYEQIVVQQATPVKQFGPGGREFTEIQFQALGLQPTGTLVAAKHGMKAGAGGSTLPGEMGVQAILPPNELFQLAAMVQAVAPAEMIGKIWGTGEEATRWGPESGRMFAEWLLGPESPLEERLIPAQPLDLRDPTTQKLLELGRLVDPQTGEALTQETLKGALIPGAPSVISAQIRDVGMETDVFLRLSQAFAGTASLITPEAFAALEEQQPRLAHELFRGGLRHQAEMAHIRAAVSANVDPTSVYGRTFIEQAASMREVAGVYPELLQQAHDIMRESGIANPEDQLAVAQGIVMGLSGERFKGRGLAFEQPGGEMAYFPNPQVLARKFGYPFQENVLNQLPRMVAEMMEYEVQRGEGKVRVVEGMLPPGAKPEDYTFEELQRIEEEFRGGKVTAARKEFIESTSSKEMLVKLLGVSASQYLVSPHPTAVLGIDPNKWITSEAALRRMIVAPGATEEEKEQILQRIQSGELEGPRLAMVGYPIVESGQAAQALGYMTPAEAVQRGVAPSKEEFQEMFAGRLGVSQMAFYGQEKDLDIDEMLRLAGTRYARSKETGEWEVEHLARQSTVEDVIRMATETAISGELGRHTEKIEERSSLERVRAWVAEKAASPVLPTEEFQQASMDKATGGMTKGAMYNVFERRIASRMTGHPGAEAARRAVATPYQTALDIKPVEGGWRNILERMYSFNLATAGYSMGEPDPVTGKKPGHYFKGGLAEYVDVTTRDILGLQGMKGQPLEPQHIASMLINPAVDEERWKKLVPLAEQYQAAQSEEERNKLMREIRPLVTRGLKPGSPEGMRSLWETSPVIGAGLEAAAWRAYTMGATDDPTTVLTSSGMRKFGEAEQWLAARGKEMAEYIEAMSPLAHLPESERPTLHERAEAVTGYVRGHGAVSPGVAMTSERAARLAAGGVPLRAGATVEPEQPVAVGTTPPAPSLPPAAEAGPGEPPVPPPPPAPPAAPAAPPPPEAAPAEGSAEQARAAEIWKAEAPFRLGRFAGIPLTIDPEMQIGARWRMAAGVHQIEVNPAKLQAMWFGGDVPTAVGREIRGEGEGLPFTGTAPLTETQRRFQEIQQEVAKMSPLQRRLHEAQLRRLDPNVDMFGRQDARYQQRVPEEPQNAYFNPRIPGTRPIGGALGSYEESVQAVLWHEAAHAAGVQEALLGEQYAKGDRENIANIAALLRMGKPIEEIEKALYGEEKIPENILTAAQEYATRLGRMTPGMPLQEWGREAGKEVVPSLPTPAAEVPEEPRPSRPGEPVDLTAEAQTRLESILGVSLGSPEAQQRMVEQMQVAHQAAVSGEGTRVFRQQLNEMIQAHPGQAAQVHQAWEAAIGPLGLGMATDPQGVRYHEYQASLARAAAGRQAVSPRLPPGGGRPTPPEPPPPPEPPRLPRPGEPVPAGGGGPRRVGGGAEGGVPAVTATGGGVSVDLLRVAEQFPGQDVGASLRFHEGGGWGVSTYALKEKGGQPVYEDWQQIARLSAVFQQLPGMEAAPAYQMLRGVGIEGGLGAMEAIRRGRTPTLTQLGELEKELGPEAVTMAGQMGGSRTDRAAEALEAFTKAVEGAQKNLDEYGDTMKQQIQDFREGRLIPTPEWQRDVKAMLGQARGIVGAAAELPGGVPQAYAGAVGGWQGLLSAAQGAGLEPAGFGAGFGGPRVPSGWQQFVYGLTGGGEGFLGAEGPMAGADRAFRSLTSGFQLMQMRRVWGMTGGWAMGQIPVAAQEEQAASRAAMATMPMGEAAAGGMALDLMSYQAQRQAWNAQVGRAAYGAWGWAQQGGLGGGLATAAGIGLPALGAGAIAGTLASTLIPGVSATGVGLPVAAAAALVGGGMYAKEAMSDQERMAVAAAGGGSWLDTMLYRGTAAGALGETAQFGTDQWLAQMAGRWGVGLQKIGSTATGGAIPWPEAPRAGEAEAYGEQILSGVLEGLAPRGRIAAVQKAAETVAGRGGELEWLGPQGAEQLLGEWLRATPGAEQQNIYDIMRSPEFSTMAMRGMSPGAYGKIGEQWGMAPGRWQEVQRMMEAVPEAEASNLLFTAGQYSPLARLMPRENILRGVFGGTERAWDEGEGRYYTRKTPGELQGLTGEQEMLLGQYAGGAPLAWSRLGLEGGEIPGYGTVEPNAAWVTRHPETGMGVGTTWGGGILAQGIQAGRFTMGTQAQGAFQQALETGELRIDASEATIVVGGQEVPLTQIGLQSAGLGLQRGEREWQREQQTLGLAAQYAYTTGQVPGWAPEGAPQFGRGAWAVEDAMTAASRQHQQAGFGFQWEQLAMQDRQFYGRLGMQEQRFGIQTSWAREDLGRGYQRQMTQFGWAEEDLAFRGAQTSLQYGWGQEDIQERMRYATGRERRQLMRQEERGTIQYAMAMGQIETEGGRLDQRRQWAEEDQNRERERFEMRTQWSRQDMDLSRQHHEEQMGLAKRRLQEDERYFHTVNGLQDEQREASREYWEYNIQKQVDAMEHARELQKELDKVQDLLDGLAQSQQQQTSWFSAQFEPSGRVANSWQGFVQAMIQGIGQMQAAASGYNTAIHDNPYIP